MHVAPQDLPEQDLPNWVPPIVRIYLAHTCSGRPLRQVAAAQGCAPSTVLRQVRRIEARRDDPLIDAMQSSFFAGDSWRRQSV